MGGKGCLVWDARMDVEGVSTGVRWRWNGGACVSAAGDCWMG
jgi:hypothetical protein